jgi:tyrosinase
VAAASYLVHVNLDEGESPGDHPELLAGVLSTFGVAEASVRDELHDGTGVTAVFDITAVRDALVREGRWDPTALRLRFTPVAPESDVPAPGAPEAADLRAGQVTVLAG